MQKDQDGDLITDYDYDEAGNLTLDGENKRFIYDAENRQTAFFNSANQMQTPDATYQYDGDGKRVKKISGQVETIFVYNGGGTLVAEYSTQLSQTPQVSYLTADHLGSPRIITDGGGVVLSRHDYTAFGGDVTETLGRIGGRTAAHGYGTALEPKDDVRKQYTGYEQDEESGLDFAQARYYNSSHGRFTSVDPLTASASIKDPQTFNRYSYVLNSPYKFTDPLGLLPVSVACGQWCTDAPYVDGSSFRGRDSSFDWAKPRAEPPPPPPPPAEQNVDSNLSVLGEGRIRFDKIEVFDILNDNPTATTIPPLYGESNTAAAATSVDIGYNPGSTTFFVKVSVSVEGDGKIVKSENPERPDIRNTRVDANTSSDSESNSGRGQKLNLATIPGSDPAVNQQVDISESGKSATITFGVKLKNDAVKNNPFTVTVYGVRNQVFGANGKLNQPETFRGGLRIKLQLPKPPDVRDIFLKKKPF